MTILQTLLDVREQIPDIKTCIYADLNEANLEADLLTVQEYPLMIIFPLAPVDTIGKSGKIKTTVNLRFFMLTKNTNYVTVEHRAGDIENNSIAPMRLLSQRYIHRLNNHSSIDPETPGIVTINYNPVFSELDANLHGVDVTAQVPIMENINVCY